MQTGHQPAVVIWDAASTAILAVLKTHQYGVAHVAFTPSGRSLVSVGSAQDPAAQLVV